jgi:hypothetical protein
MQLLRELPMDDHQKDEIWSNVTADLEPTMPFLGAMDWRTGKVYEYAPQAHAQESGHHSPDGTEAIKHTLEAFNYRGRDPEGRSTSEYQYEVLGDIGQQLHEHASSLSRLDPATIPQETRKPFEADATAFNEVHAKIVDTVAQSAQYDAGVRDHLSAKIASNGLTQDAEDALSDRGKALLQLSRTPGRAMGQTEENALMRELLTAELTLGQDTELFDRVDSTNIRFAAAAGHRGRVEFLRNNEQIAPLPQAPQTQAQDS